MIPHFGSTSDSSASPRGPTSVPPPPLFRALCGTPEHVRILSLVRNPGLGLTSAQRMGLRYEAKVHARMNDLFGPTYQVSPTLSFEDGSPQKTRILIPDAIWSGGDGHFTIFEVKRQHCPEAWWQLRQLYQPVLQAISYVRSVSVCEVCSSFDPSMPFPEEFDFVQDLKEWLSRHTNNFGVYQWRL